VKVTRSIVIRRCRAAILALTTAVSIAAAKADVLTGRASVINADTLGLGGQEIRLLGIDAPEIEQSCWDASGLPWPCGRRAALMLSTKVGSAIVECKGSRRDRSARLIAVCRAGDTNLNAWLVAEGWALAYRSQSLAYVQAEEAARELAKGLWAGAFEPPWVWRTKN
jgi:endonuclease YncB( thermonuclease family)